MTSFICIILKKIDFYCIYASLNDIGRVHFSYFSFNYGGSNDEKESCVGRGKYFFDSDSNGRSFSPCLRKRVWRCFPGPESIPASISISISILNCNRYWRKHRTSDSHCYRDRRASKLFVSFKSRYHRLWKLK